MTSERRVRMLLVAAIVVAAAGAVDAAVGSVWDQFTILAVVIVTLAVAMAMMTTDRPSVSVRADLVRWLRMRAAIEGESLETLVDRSIASSREHLRPGTKGPP